MKNWTLVATFFCLWISTMFGNEIQTYLAYGLILTFGMLHGANDISLIRIKFRNKGIYLKYYSILAYYVLTILVILGIFFTYAPLALFLFVILSAYHFGEQHYKSKIEKGSWLGYLLYGFYGLTILFMIFYYNMDGVLLIFKDLTSIDFTPFFFGTILLVSALLFLGCLIRLSVLKRIRVNIVKELFYLLVFAVIFSTAGLLWGFCIYFILWHSIPSLVDQMKFLYGKSSKTAFMEYLKSSWLYWLIAIIGLLSLHQIFRENTGYLTSILIYFLSAITFPHVIVMSTLESD